MKKIGNLNNFSGRINFISKKLGFPNSYAFGRSIDTLSDPSEVTLLPLAEKISDTVVTDLPMWGAIACDNLYFHGNTGNVYKVDSNDLVTKEFTVPDSVGNGLGFLAEDKCLYIPSNKSITRRTNACGVGEYFPNFLESEGGEPTNTYALVLNGTNQYATIADGSQVGLDLTGSFTFEAYGKMSALPSGNDTSVILSKWDENSNQRAYVMEIVPTTASFGNSADGAVTDSSNRNLNVVDANFSATAGDVAITISNVSGTFVAGDAVILWQTKGTTAGRNEIRTILSVVSTTVTFTEPITSTYIHSASSSDNDKAQIIKIPQYSSWTINSGVTVSAKVWDGLKGGLNIAYVNGDFTVPSGAWLSTDACGFRGGTATSAINQSGKAGESYTGTYNAVTHVKQGGAGGGGANLSGGAGSGGGGAGHATAGSNGVIGHVNPGQGGDSYGDENLDLLIMGSGGGSGGSSYSAISAGAGGRGAGINYIIAKRFIIGGTISSNGQNGVNTGGHATGAGGAGSAGGNKFVSQEAVLGTGLIQATAGTGGINTASFPTSGGASSVGRNVLTYSTSVTGTTTPTLKTNVDATLNGTAGYQLRVRLSSNGTSEVSFYNDVSDVDLTKYNRLQAKYNSSTGTVSFLINSVPRASMTRSITSIFNSSASFCIGANFNSTAKNFFGGKLDDLRVWNLERTDSELSTFNDRILTGDEGGLKAYFEFTQNLTDTQAAGNNSLTQHNTPTYTTDVPFSGASVRLDEDVFYEESGQTYTFTTALNEGATHRRSFVPTKEPVKSVAFNIDTVSTGNVTVVVHDSLNREQASVTVVAAQLHTGVYEFIFPETFRPVLNSTYHVHIYSTVADGKVVTDVASELTAAYFKSFFQILVDDIYHPVQQFLNFLCIGNERYLAVLEAGAIYNPRRIILPSGYRIRSLTPWNSYIAIGTWQGEDVGDTDQGKVFFWDGTSDTYVEPLEVPQGSINSLFGAQGELIISAGYRGQVLRYTGGTKARQIFTIPERKRYDTIELAPAAITMWQNMYMFGGMFNTDSETVHQGVYSWGSPDDSTIKESLGFDYPLSSGDTMSNLARIACIIPRGKKLYVGNQNNDSYGIDAVDMSSNNFGTGTLEMSISDVNLPSSNGLPLIFKPTFLPLEEGQTISVRVKRNRATNWSTVKTVTTAGAYECKVDLNERDREVQFAIDLSTTTSNPPTIIDLGLYIDDEKEGRLI